MPIICCAMFQFHTGSIRSWTYSFRPSGDGWFQFHTGSIRSCVTTVAPSLFICFNSTLVRLEGGDTSKAPCKVNSGFNSTLVRLEVALTSSTRCTLPSFNSTLVRLEGHGQPQGFCGVCEFQFHTGSIRRNRPTMTVGLSTEFQFHTGSSRSVVEVAEVAHEIKVSIPHWFD